MFLLDICPWTVSVPISLEWIMVYTKPGLGHGSPCGLRYGLPYGPPQILSFTNNEEKN